DSYLFGALPSNSGGGDGVYNTGTIFWGWIAESFFSDATYCYCINYNNDEFSNGLHKKDSAYAVRCVKN
ncbi:MAG: hypothetical protein IKS58_05550, partial [Paludibacteraceae bacterium]|nr:hypothetical protein [Paludibacteraceae bacterium]